MKILDSKIVDQRRSRRNTLYLKHVSDIEQLVASCWIAILEVIQTRRVILEWQSLKVAQSVIEGNREDWKHKLSIHFSLLLFSESLIELDDLLQVHDGIGMEEVELALPEDFTQVLEEVWEDLLHARGVVLLSVDQLIDVFGGAESIRPNL